MNAIDPCLRDHALALADKEWGHDSMNEPTSVIECGPRAWFVLQTVVRGEHKAQEALVGYGYETYLPVMRKEIWNKQKKRVIEREFLLFNRYLFAELPRNTLDWASINSIEEIDRPLGANGCPCAIPESDIRRFMDAQEAMEFDDTREAKIRRGEISRRRRDNIVRIFPPGSRVRAKQGPFGGFSGLVRSVVGRGAVEVMIEIFSGLVPVEFPLDMVELA